MIPPLSPVCGRWPDWQLIKGKSGKQSIYDTCYTPSFLCSFLLPPAQKSEKCSVDGDSLKDFGSPCLLSMTKINQCHILQ